MSDSLHLRLNQPELWIYAWSASWGARSTLAAKCMGISVCSASVEGCASMHAW